MHRSEIEIDPKIDLLDIESKTEIKVAAMLQLQPQKVISTQSLKLRHLNKFRQNESVI